MNGTLEMAKKKKTKEMDNKVETLKKNFELTANGYVKMLCKKWHLEESYGFWVSDEVGGLWCYGDNYALDYDTIRIIVNEDVNFADFDQWNEYCIWAKQYNQNIPNFRSWLNGCPRISDEVRQKLVELKAEFEKACKDAKESLF